MINFRHILSICGWAKETDAFKHIMAQIWVHDYYPKYGTVEELLCNPYVALEYARDVIAATDLEGLKKEDVLRFLLNLRKAKFLQEYEKHSLQVR